MSSRCSEPSCLNGNCEGCRDGTQYCEDPRCYPNCPDCDTTTNNSGDWIIAVIILILAGILLLFLIIAGFDYWNKTTKAAEPKNITVHKHVNQVVPTPAPTSIVTPAPLTTSINTSIKSYPTKRNCNDFTLKSPSNPITSSNISRSVSISGYE